MIDVKSLREFGANVDEGLARCLNNEEFYLKMVNLGLQDARFEQISEILKKKDYDAAFETVHALKGVIGNLALTPLYSPIDRMTELLRKRTDTDYTELCDEIKKQRGILLSM